MTQHRKFVVQLENFRNEATNVACYVYGEMAVQHAASKSRRLLHRLNRTPTFWRISAAAFQSAAYISIARIFDPTSRYNVGALLDAAERDVALFQRDSLAERKRDGKPTDPPWLEGYLNAAFYPTVKYFQQLRQKVDRHRSVYKRIIKPARDKYIAHRVSHGQEVQELFGRGTLRELWRLTTFLLQLNEALEGLLNDGRKPKLRPMRYSIRSIYDSKDLGNAAHEYIVRDVKKLMHLIDSAPPNHLLQRRAARQ